MTRQKISRIAARVFVWCGLFLILYLMRSFFLLVFLTFLFAYIQSHSVAKLIPYIRSRAARVTLVGICFLAIWVGVGAWLIPQVIKEAEGLAEKHPQYIQALDAELLKVTVDYPALANFLPNTLPHQAASPEEAWIPQHSAAVNLLYHMLGLDAGGADDVRRLFEFLQGIGKQLIAIGSTFFLALLFSFLIVLDLPKLSASIASLKDTKVKFIYQEVSDSIISFGKVLGHAIEAQLLIALCNTAFTAIMIAGLGLGEKIAFLSLIVFVCSFIPVAGVFISSVPICLLVLKESGIHAVFFVALGIWVIHLIEGYILNPRIYGARLRINPVLVLMILTVSGKLFGIWGLVLGVPICTYLFGHAIQHQKNQLAKPERATSLA